MASSAVRIDADEISITTNAKAIRQLDEWIDAISDHGAGTDDFMQVLEVEIGPLDEMRSLLHALFGSITDVERFGE